jgi:hypothetical protein
MTELIDLSHTVESGMITRKRPNCGCLTWPRASTSPFPTRELLKGRVKVLTSR